MAISSFLRDCFIDVYEISSKFLPPNKEITSGWSSVEPISELELHWFLSSSVVMRLLFLVAVALLLNLLSSSFLDKISVSAEEGDLLLLLKRGFNDPIELASWNETSFRAICYAWKGITCGNNSLAVTMITLPKAFRGGVITPAIGGLRFLQDIDLSNNFLYGSIPPAIGGLPFLQNIDLSNNFLNGSIPPAINALTTLITLDLSRNLLTGSLPQDWSSLTKLTKLNLRRNQLNGSIPVGLSEAVSLQFLRFENNNLSGGIPSQLVVVGDLRYFAVEYNALTGPIPEDFGRLTRLRSIYAAYNQLNGSLPDSIGNLTKLLHFEVEGNRLSGSIPASFGNFTRSLLTVNLSDNNFSGQVPVSLSKFTAASFANNLNLCGFPLPNCTSPTEPPPPPVRVYPPPLHKIPPPRNPPRGSSGQKVKIVGGTIGGVLGAFALLIFLVVIRRRSDRRRAVAEGQNWFSPDIQANRRKGKFEMFGRPDFEYVYEEIVSHAGFFDTAHVLGKGRFATVYRSSLPDGTELAVKVFKFANVSAIFEREIETLSSIRHRSILPIRGLYSNQVEKTIFYDYLPRGTLYDLLHTQGTNPSSLPDWAARQRIALGVAQALSYLHRGCTQRFYHRDVKSTNVLLDTDLTPRLSDVGLTQLVSTRPHEDTTVVETPGYTAPEVLTTRKYSEKADVYGYGVVLMELITGKKAIYYIEERAVNLTDWVMRLQAEKRGREIMDAVAWRTCPFPEYLDKALNLAVVCVDENPSARPSMSEVAGILEGLASNPSPLRSPDFRDDKRLLL